MIYRSRAEFQRLGFIHRLAAVAVFVLLASGLLLYAEPLRGVIAPVRVPLKYLHVGAGLALAAWALRTLVDWGSFLVRGGLHLGRRLNTVLSALWLLAWTVSGLLMYLRGTVDYALANTATMAHDWLTWLAIPWVVLHTAFRLARVRRIDEELNLGFEGPPGTRHELADWLARPATRRGFVWATLGAAGLWVAARWFRSAALPDLYPAGDDPATAAPAVDPKTLPGGGMKGRFRLYFVNNTVPRFTPDTWRLTVGGKSYTWQQFQALSRVTAVRNFHCVTGWSVFDISWEGVRLSDLLTDAGMAKSPAVVFHSGDGEYTDSLTWDQAQLDDVILVDTMDGRPLPAVQGGPVRLLVPQMYGYKSVKWVEQITASTNAAYSGYWEDRGYDANAFLERGEKQRGS